MNVLNHVTLRRAPRGRPDLVGCLPRCVRTDGRIKLCAILVVPTLVEPHTFVQWVLKEEHSHQTFGQWRRKRFSTIIKTPKFNCFVDYVVLRAHKPRPWHRPRQVSADERMGRLPDHSGRWFAASLLSSSSSIPGAASAAIACACERFRMACLASRMPVTDIVDTTSSHVAHRDRRCCGG